MTIDIGDYVAWDFKQHCFDSGASIGFITRKSIFKGCVTKIKTHDFFFFKREYPLYKVNNVWVRRVKPIVTVHYKEYRSPTGSFYEAESHTMYRHKPEED